MLSRHKPHKKDMFLEVKYTNLHKKWHVFNCRRPTHCSATREGIAEMRNSVSWMRNIRLKTCPSRWTRCNKTIIRKTRFLTANWNTLPQISTPWYIYSKVISERGFSPCRMLSATPDGWSGLWVPSLWASFAPIACTCWWAVPMNCAGGRRNPPLISPKLWRVRSRLGQELSRNIAALPSESSQISIR